MSATQPATQSATQPVTQPIRPERFLRMMEDLMELAPDSLDGSETLSSLEEWNSLTTIQFMAMVDAHFGRSLDVGRLMACATVNDLYQSATS